MMEDRCTGGGVNLQRMITPKWQVFLESLAGILKMSFVAVSPSGEIQAVYNPKPPFSLLAGYPLLERAYRGFFKEIAAHYKPELEGRLIADPLGLPAVVLQLQEEAYLVLGAFTQRDHAYLAALQSRLQSLGVSQDNRIWLQMTFLSASDLSSTAEHIRVIYRHLCRTLDETTELGQQMLLLAAVEEINKLMVESLNPEKFDLERILDLVVSSLVILSDVAGAWAFVCQDPGKTLGCYRGQCTDLLGHLQEAWEASAAAGDDPCAPLSRLQRQNASRPLRGNGNIATEGYFSLPGGARQRQPDRRFRPRRFCPAADDRPGGGFALRIGPAAFRNALQFHCPRSDYNQYAR